MNRTILNENKTPMARKGMRRSQRIIHFATKVTPEFDNLIRQQAEKEGLMLVEMLEKYQQAYGEKAKAGRK
ncbi:MAG: hypothetical protein MRERV_28c019 [Mycoplasmataceae bacterium RV_VA103A]|nr:MAG: hypothetical protein MRERV_28c019 [Mycoplasmataceae bacterium RV_VA103A]